MWFRKSHCRSIRNIAPGCGRSFSYSCLAHKKFVCFCCTVAPRSRCLFCHPVSLWGRYVICIDGSMYARAMVNISSSFPLFCALGFASLWKRSCGKFVSLLFGVFFLVLYCSVRFEWKTDIISFLCSVLPAPLYLSCAQAAYCWLVRVEGKVSHRLCSFRPFQ